MPMKPHAGESQSEFMSRCVPEMIGDGKREQEQAVAICMDIWRRKDADADAKAGPPREGESHADFMARCTAYTDEESCQMMWEEYAGKALRKSTLITVGSGVGGGGGNSRKIERAWSVLTIKGMDTELRTIEGIASTPEVDRVGDIMEPMGAKFTVPMPLLWHHKHDQPVGHVVEAKATKTGISIKARFAKIDEPGELKNLIDKAWQSVKAGLVKGLSIGFKPADDGVIPLDNGGLRFTKWNWYELSLVTIPANAGATIGLIKSIDQDLQAASGNSEVAVNSLPGVSGKDGGPSEGPEKALRQTRSPVTLKSKKDREKMKTFSEQIADLESSRAAKSARMAQIMQKSVDEGRSTDEAEQEEFDELERAVDAIDKDLKRFRVLEAHNKAKAQPLPASVATTEDGTAARTGRIQIVQPKPAKGIQFARLARVAAISRLDMRSMRDVAEELYGSRDPDVVECVKTPVNAATTYSPNWAGNLVGINYAVAADFIEFLRPRTILGRFGTDGIPDLRRVPFRVGLAGQTSGGAGYWVGEAAAKPVTKFDFGRVTLEPLKVANIAVLTEELIRDSSPSAEGIVRDQLARAVAERLDIDFIDPGKTAVAGVSPASITNGITPIAASGNDITNLYADVQSLLNSFINNNNALASGVWIMRENVALTLSMMRDTLQQLVFPTMTARGGTFFGLPVIASQYVPLTSAASPTDSTIILVNAEDIYLGDEGGIQVDMSREASLVMDNLPVMTSAGVGGSPNAPTAAQMVSMFQTNSVALRAERTINWARRRVGAVAVLSGVAYILG
jgi:HK97 family phage prohead protease